MGMFEVDIEVSNPLTGHYSKTRAIVDTGCIYSMVPAQLLRELDIIPAEKSSGKIADGVVQEFDVGEARFRLDGKERTAPVIFGPDPKVHLLGAVTLESFGLSADLMNARLVPTKMLMVGMIPEGTIQGNHLVGTSSEALAAECKSQRPPCQEPPGQPQPSLD